MTIVRRLVLGGASLLVLALGCDDVGDPLAPLRLPPPMPFIARVAPDSAEVGASIVVDGRDFGPTPGSIDVGGQRAAPSSWGDASIETTVPAGATSGVVVVRTAAGSSNLVPFVVAGTPPPLPVIDELLPVRTVAGDTLRLVGTSFGPAPGALRVVFTNAATGSTASVLTWTNERVTVLVPPDAVTGEVFLANDERRSTGRPFGVAPRLVSLRSDLGPIFLRQGCSSCHFDRSTGTNGFSVASVADILAGGFHGPAAVPRDAARSLIVQVVRGTAADVPRMPYLGNPMPDPEIELIEDWVNQGLRDN